MTAGARRRAVRVARGGPGCAYFLAGQGGAGAALALALINNPQRGLNCRGLRGLFTTDAPGGDVFILRTYCALSTKRTVLCTYQQKPEAQRPLYPVVAECESARLWSRATTAAAGDRSRRPPTHTPPCLTPGPEGAAPANQSGEGNARSARAGSDMGRVHWEVTTLAGSGLRAATAPPQRASQGAFLDFP